MVEDREPPSVSIVTPRDGADVPDSQDVLVTVAGLDDVEVVKVELLLDGTALLNIVDRRTDLLPTWIQGHLTGQHEDREDLAVAVNGTIEATTWSFPGPGGETLFSAMVPETALRNGHNDVAVLLVRTGSDLNDIFD